MHTATNSSNYTPQYHYFNLSDPTLSSQHSFFHTFQNPYPQYSQPHNFFHQNLVFNSNYDYSDIKQHSNDIQSSKFYIFDINLKQNITPISEQNESVDIFKPNDLQSLNPEVSQSFKDHPPHFSQFIKSRKNNYIIKIIFTQFKHIMRLKGSNYSQFFKYRPYTKNHVTLIDFQKIFSFVEWRQQSILENKLQEDKMKVFRSFLEDNMQKLMCPIIKYEQKGKQKEAKQYRLYLKIILQALQKGRNYIQRLKILYRNGKYKCGIKKIEKFISQILQDEQIKRGQERQQGLMT